LARLPSSTPACSCALLRRHHHGKLALCDLVAEQYPFVIFHGDVGTGKTATAE
jgi:predicted ribonuclease YlaK